MHSLNEGHEILLALMHAWLHTRWCVNKTDKVSM